VPVVPIALATGWSALVLWLLQVPLNPLSATLGALVLALGAFGLLPGPGQRVTAPGGLAAAALLDAQRHLLTVGVLASVVVAMTFRLIPVLELTALAWPRLRGVAFVALLGAVLARSAQVLLPDGGVWLRWLVVLSGGLAWIALACAAANLGAAMRRRRAGP
jgi:hypothetical protein